MNESRRCRLLVAAGLCAILLFQVRPAGPENAGREAAPAPRNTTRGVSYVGSQVCATCHAGIYKSFAQTGMGRSMAPGDDPSLAYLPAPATVYDRDLGQYFEVLRKDGQLYQSQYALDNAGKEVFRQTWKMEYGVGAGENGIGFIVRRDRFLFEAPLSYYSQAHRWSFSPGYEIQNRGFTRPILAQCISCHSGRPRPVTGQVGLYQDPPFDELAVGCENCHGPGALHVAEHTAGKTAATPNIVNPARLSGWLSDNICMRCHQGKDVRVNPPGMQDQDFRPGMPLDPVVSIFKLPLEAPAASGTALLEHYYGMTLSKCYRSTAGGLHCIHCHDPHVEPSREAAVDFYRSRCLACHNQQSCTLSREKRMATSPPDDCISCHMPKRTVATITHGALTDHSIPAKEGEELAGNSKLIHLTAPFGQREDLSSVAPLVLMQVYETLSRDGHEEFRAPLDQLLDKLSRSHPADPLVLRALARRAASHDSPEQREQGIRYMSQAILISPANVDDLIFIAELYIGQKRSREAVEWLEKARASNPNLQEIYELLADQFMALGDYKSALHTLQEGIKLFPADPKLRTLDQKVRSATLDGMVGP